MNISSLPALSLGNDTLLCVGQTLLLSATSSGASYQWQAGSRADTFLVSQSGRYWVQVAIGNCWVSDSIEVRYTSPPKVNLGADRVSCDGRPLLLKSTFHGAHYRWSTGSIDTTLLVEKSGQYWLEVSNSCGVAYDTVNIMIESVSSPDLGRDTTICVGDTMVLQAVYANADLYHWSDGSSQSTLHVYSSGMYEVEVNSKTCTIRCKIRVEVVECPDKIFVPNVITPNGDIYNERFVVKGIQPGKWRLEIYNRLGQQVYISSGYYNDWNAEGLENSVYYYLLRDTDSRHSYKGWVEVLR